MTESRTDAVMAHASDVLRNAPEPGWDRISDKVIRRYGRPRRPVAARRTRVGRFHV